jgi:hypothetical protein
MGVSLEKVTNDFGQGATMVALPALEAGMIHEIAPFAEVLRAQAPPRSGASVTQTLIFSKAEFPKREDAVKWAREHDFRTDKVDETESSWRLRQRDPGDFARFRTIARRRVRRPGAALYRQLHPRRAKSSTGISADYTGEPRKSIEKRQDQQFPRLRAKKEFHTWILH